MPRRIRDQCHKIDSPIGGTLRAVYFIARFAQAGFGVCFLFINLRINQLRNGSMSLYVSPKIGSIDPPSAKPLNC